MLTRFMEDDTRLAAQSRVAQLPIPGRLLAERYVAPESPVFFGAQPMDTLAALDLKYLAVSSFAYDRHVLGGTLWWQDDIVYVQARRYAALFTCPYVEIKPAYRTYAPSKPTIRIIFLQQCPKDLDYS